jgi:ubiquinone/menaquinone biosynthesis C-methylase UbiE
MQRRELHGDVLEIGCGSGAMAGEMLRRFPAVHVTATDYDQSMVCAAVERLTPFGDRAAVLRADATALPFPDETFDGVATFIMLHHVIDWEGALREAARVLRPGGLLAGYDVVGNGSGALINAKQHGTRRMRVEELRAHLDALPLTGSVARPGFGGRVVRFRAARSAPGG